MDIKNDKRFDIVYVWYHILIVFPTKMEYFKDRHG